MWSNLLCHLQQKPGQIVDIEMLKDVLTQACSEIPETTHFEHY